MKLEQSQDPGWVDVILDWSGTWVLARVALTSAFLIGGVTKALDFSAAVAEQNQLGLHPAPVWAVFAIVIELVGPLLVISGYFVWLGAGAIGVLTAIAMVVSTPFWSLAGTARFVAVNGFFEHMGLIAGCVMAALLAEHAGRRRRQTETKAS
jgi:uncharacterized membrane protein YphA (DoxX/SURF4 family)